MDDYIRNGENESCIFNPLFELKEAEKYQFIEMFVFMECLYTKNP